MQTIRTVLVDDNECFRQCVKRFLTQQSHIHIDGEAGDCPSAMKLIAALKPDLVLMDIRLPECSGIDLTRSIKNICPDTSVIMLTLCDMDEYRRAALECGAAGFVAKRNMTKSLLAVIEKCVTDNQGDSHVSQ